MLWEKSVAIKMSVICVVSIIFMFLILYVCSYITTYYGHLIATKMERDMRNEIFYIIKNFRIHFMITKKSENLCHVWLWI